MLRHTPFLTYFSASQRFFAEVTTVLSHASQSSGSVEPHSQEHNHRIMEILKKRNSATQFVVVDLEPGTVLEGRDIAYAIEGTMPFFRSNTPLELFPLSVQRDIIRADIDFDTIQQTIKISRSIKVVANQDQTIFYIDPSVLSAEPKNRLRP